MSPSGSPLRGLIMDLGGVLTDGPSMTGLVRRARAAGRPTALVSDAHAVPEGCAGLFDVLVLGPALGVRKPDPEVFRRTADRLGLAVADCVVVDDLAANVRGARAAGAVVVHHVDPETTVSEVEILLGLPRPWTHRRS
ncbi:HAD-IA family hydrolase [Pseudonocardia sp.]|uniref:HAD-IA family hydrolase n=1 Tax=Pseudonocardia sp. TaxID=60912 RepID=UPI00262BC530|nr:HAD-IA family hydrolase [Pseudonocardia sp.]